MHGEMLNRRHGLQVVRVVSLQATHKGYAVASRQKRIFAVGFLSTTPAWITENIDIGRPDGQPAKFLGTAPTFSNGLVVLGTSLGGNGIGHALDEFGIPCRSETDGLRKYGGDAISRHAVQRLVPPIILGDVETGNGRARHHQLGDFFFHGEAADQIVHALCDRQFGITKGQARRLGGRGLGGEPRGKPYQPKRSQPRDKRWRRNFFHRTFEPQ